MTINNGTHAIVADIGGTHARFACINLTTLLLSKLVIYRCSEFSSLEVVFKKYQLDYGLMHIQHAAIAVACPVNGDDISMTNLSWRFSIKRMKNQLNLEELVVINDFIAIALSLTSLSNEEKITIGSASARPSQPIVLLGPGTGLGVAFLMPNRNDYLPISSEAGHMGWMVETEIEFFIHQHLTKQFGRVSVERVLSGTGLEAIYSALAIYNKVTVQALSAETIAQQALNGTSSLAVAAVMQFFKSLASFAGDLALAMNAYGGVYLAGGILPRLRALLNEHLFRNQFEAKGRFSKVNKQIPTYLITAKQPGLVGASIALRNQ